MIPFNRPPYTGSEEKYVISAIRGDKISGDGQFGCLCQEWFEQRLECKRALLTPSCTHALEMAAILIDIQPGDEVIMPSYTFVSTANAFALRGARIVFVDVRADTMNIDESLIEAAITPRTKAIIPVHYAGIGCDMASINEVARKYGLFVIEDAAQGMMSSYHGRPLGTLGHIAAYSFHETKNFTSGGEGGLLIINDERFINRAEIVREKGTNRSQFFRGMVDKYTWVDLGSSYLPSEIQAAYLWGQLQMADAITTNRLAIWDFYHNSLLEFGLCGRIELPVVPPVCQHNGHIYYFKCRDIEDRTALISYMRERNIFTVFHYVPLHSAPAGRIFGRFHGSDRYTTKDSERLVRLPIWYGMDNSTQEYIIECLRKYLYDN